ncbi:MAG: hypothetical protein INR66_21210 [Gordonia polyisoprenivorans]|nr:hypothetical protein [Gordonia polyisoprenivorans]
MSEIQPLKFGLSAIYVHRPPPPPPPAPRCGFPTQSGAECRNLVAAWGDLCRVHQTDESEPW